MRITMSPAQVTAAEIARLAGVTRATVSNWRRRHADFPAPVGGTETSPAYDLELVRTWLAARGQLPVSSPVEGVRIALRAAPRAAGLPLATRLLPLVLAAARMDPAERERLAKLPDARLVKAARAAARPLASEVGGIDPAFGPGDADAVRAVLHCVADAGAAAAADALASTGPDESGTYRTPEPLAGLMADLIARPGAAYPASVLDPACGAGSLLAAAAVNGATEFYGQELVDAQAALAAVRLALDAPAARRQVHIGDSIRADAFPGLTVDAVLCNPPFGNREWGHEELAYDPRWAYGLPPKGEPELAWVQHCLAHLAPGGTAVVLMPPAAAERAAGRRARAGLIRAGALRAVVALPPGAAAPLHIGLHLWLLRGPTEPDGVLFVDTAGPERRTVDWEALRDTVRRAWEAFLTDPAGFPPTPGTAGVVPAVDLLDETVDLTPSRHIHTGAVVRSPDQHANATGELRNRLVGTAGRLRDLGADSGWPSAGDTAVTWRSATVADLMRGGALTLLRGAPAGRGTTAPAGERVTIRPGDVILAELLRGGPGARVAGETDDGQSLGRQLHLLRPDPERLDPWFLAGFLAAEDNLRAAATGTSIVRVDARRLRVPLMPLAEQRRYGQAFRHTHALRSAAAEAAHLADELTRALEAGLTNGALVPPDPRP